MARDIKLRPAARRGLAAGFTIVELMIATLVFSMVLLVVTYGVLHFTHDYYQGVNSSTTQGVARNVADTLSQAIQFGGSTPIGSPSGSTSGYLCAGNVEFNYRLDKTVGNSGSWALLRFPITGTCYTGAVPNAPAGTKPTEMLQPRMRLLKFDVSPVSAGSLLYKVDIGIALGEDDLLCDTKVTPPTSTGGCDTSAASLGALPLPGDADSIRCKASSGAAQFCDVALLSTVAQTRLTP
ncbi:MAG TPA: hypothetical protein VFH39_03110 [Candidatus Saccharimonadales bacterium]|nr:hypothetical protein [Candidatus Saccharimonadales bacterium]